ncbi:MAG: adenylyltransferase/cytidyltransferase family protein [Candidatus Levybacteria bacterium]|nr:adenylyltransferase/cytidyltransferase family protein [Candidatus Levybacteria bacterium]
MNKILTIEQAERLSKKLRSEGKKIVLVGGCFDILHPGHVLFLEKAKQQGDVLFVMLESDQTIQLTKGNKRPIHPQKDRALVLSTLNMVDYIILLPSLNKDRDYDNLLFKIKPTIIATTKGDPKRYHKERQAKLMGTTVIDVMERVKDASTSQLTKLLSI